MPEFNLPPTAKTEVKTVFPKLKAVVFDAYGTLFDVHSVVALADSLFPGRGVALSELWRAKQLEYTWLRSLMGTYADFGAITEAALAYAGAALDLPLDGGKTARLMAAYDNLAIFPDARAGAGCAGRPQARDTVKRLAGDVAPARRARAPGGNAHCSHQRRRN